MDELVEPRPVEAHELAVADRYSAEQREHHKKERIHHLPVQSEESVFLVFGFSETKLTRRIHSVTAQRPLGPW
jgi:hypothetical protein